MKRKDERSYKIYHKRLVRDVAMLDNQNKEYLQGLPQSYKGIEKLKEANEKLVSEKRPEDREFQFKDCRRVIG